MSTRELKLAVKNHGKKHELGTWMNLLDPYDNQVMVNMVEDHVIFFASPKNTINRVLKQSQLFNDFDIETCQVRITYLYESLSPEFQFHLQLLVDPAEQDQLIYIWI